MPTPDVDIEEVFRKAEEEGGVAELTVNQLWQLILYECEQGNVTVDELLEVLKTAIWPKGKCNVWAGDAELLLSMLPEDFINRQLS